MTELVDGQVYRWRWADPVKDADSAPYRSYHCKSQIAVVRNGQLIDTFWSFGATDNSVLRPEDVVLTLVAYESWPLLSPYEVRYYDPADYADTRHSNDSRAPIYKRPGAMRSHGAIAQEIEYLEEIVRSQIRSAEHSQRWIDAEKAKLLSGDFSDLAEISLPVLRP